MLGKKQRNKLFAAVLVLAMAVTQWSGVGSLVPEVKAASDTVNLRLVYTSDVHGQVNSVDYETGAIFSEGGLSKAATLLNQARLENGAENTLAFDVGDCLYDYTTDYIYDYDDTAVQPIYTALSKIGYDAITLGNHEFDYTLDYLKKQLTMSGMADKVVLSNVMDANTGKTVWAENKIIEKTMKTDAGNQITVKVGLIGEVIPGLSKKRTSYTGVLKTEDIVQNVTREAADLKNQGADVVVVLNHSGVGTENPEYLTNNVGYALTKIPQVDAVLCGHKHSFFCADGTTEYDRLPGVDTSTGLVNGKNLIQVQNRGAGIGIADLTLSAASGSVQIVGRKSSVRKVKESTATDQTVSDCIGSWANLFISDCSEILSDMDADTRLENYFGPQEDSGAIQLLNDIKMNYGLRYINSIDTAYKDYPVLAASTYVKYGSEDGSNYVDITKQFRRSNMYDLIEYKTGLYVFQITGSQLKEWMEWSASAYAQAGGDIVVPAVTPEPTPSATPDPTEPATASALKSSKRTFKTAFQKLDKNFLPQGIQEYSGSEPLQYSLQENYLTDWSNLYIFDGVEYTVDTNVAPRYDSAGNLLQDTHRITSLTRNGVPVQDTDNFVIVSHRLPELAMFTKLSEQKLVSTSTNAYRDYIETYIEKESMSGTMKNTVDNNWKVQYSDDSQYLLVTSAEAAKLADAKKWITQLLDGEDGYNFYRANFENLVDTDTTGPNLSLASTNEVETNKDVRIAVQASDLNGISSLNYLVGKYDVQSSVWANSIVITDGGFDCSENDVYSVLAIDGKGNRTIRYIRVDNINHSILEAPKVDSYTNRKTEITGTAEPEATIYFELASGKTYSSTVKASGKFSYALTPQKAGSTVFVYVKDKKGRASARTVVTVKRTGPNKPSLNGAKTSSRVISGDLNDTYTYPMIVVEGKTIYLQKGGIKDLYKASSFYSSKYKVVETEYKVTTGGAFSVTLPKLQKATTKIELKTIDALSRCSLKTSTKVKQTVPAKAITNVITNKTKMAKIYSEEKCASAIVKIGKKSYTTTKKKYISSKKMYQFSIKIPKTSSKTTLKFYLTNIQGTSKVLKEKPMEVVPVAPVVNKVYAGTKRIKGTVDLVSSSKPDQVTVSTTKTKVFVYVNKKKYQARINNKGSFVAKVHGVYSGCRIVIKTKNRKGTGMSRTVYAK